MTIQDITPMAVKDCLIRTAKRFPITIGFTTAFAIFAMAMVWHPDMLEESTKIDVLCYLAEGILLSMALKFWDERTGKSHLWQQVVAHVLLLAVAVAWYFIGYLGSGLVTAHLSIFISLLMACVFLPFREEEDDIPACNFGAHLVKSSLIAPIAGLVPTLLLCMLVSISFPIFFDIEASEEDYLSIVIFFQVVFPMLLFLSRIVKGKRMTNRLINVSDWVDKFAKVILIPAAAIYMIILYCYECHIALAWELPNGGVSYLVAVMMGLFFIVETYLYFTNHAGDKETTGWFLRWLPLMIMPLLLLMSIGIYRRISDYGLTASRLYLATLNVWFYIVCFFMLRTKMKRINWIPTSFCIIFMLTSVLPVNYHSIAKNYIINDLNKKAAQWDKMDGWEKDEWNSRVWYMKNYYDIEYKAKQ